MLIVILTPHEQRISTANRVRQLQRTSSDEVPVIEIVSRSEVGDVFIHSEHEDSLGRGRVSAGYAATVAMVIPVGLTLAPGVLDRIYACVQDDSDDILRSAGLARVGHELSMGLAAVFTVVNGPDDMSFPIPSGSRLPDP